MFSQRRDEIYVPLAADEKDRISPLGGCLRLPSKVIGQVNDVGMGDGSQAADTPDLHFSRDITLGEEPIARSQQLYVSLQKGDHQIIRQSALPFINAYFQDRAYRRCEQITYVKAKHANLRAAPPGNSSWRCLPNSSRHLPA